MVKVIGVKFKTSGRVYYFDPLDLDIKAGDGPNSFEYDLMKSTTEQVHIRFYVGTYNQKQVKPA